MPKLLPRIAAALTALPLAATLGTAPAAADTTVPGCYGLAVVVCDVTVEWGVPLGVGTYQTQVPLCLGSCTYVPVTLVGTAPGEPLQACVSYRTLSGSAVRQCADGGTGVDPGAVIDPSVEIELVSSIKDLVRDQVAPAVAEAVERLQNPDLQPIIDRIPELHPEQLTTGLPPACTAC